MPPEVAMLSIRAFRAGSNATSAGMLFGKTKLLGREVAPPLAGGGGGGGGGAPRFAPGKLYLERTVTSNRSDQVKFS